MGNLELCLKKMAKGVFYFNALDSSPVDEENRFAASTVNGRPILGIFENLEGESAFIYFRKTRSGREYSFCKRKTLRPGKAYRQAKATNVHGLFGLNLFFSSNFFYGRKLYGGE